MRWSTPNVYTLSPSPTAYFRSHIQTPPFSSPSHLLAPPPRTSLKMVPPSQILQDSFGTTATRNSFIENIHGAASIPRVPPESRHPKCPPSFKQIRNPANPLSEDKTVGEDKTRRQIRMSGSMGGWKG